MDHNDLNPSSQPQSDEGRQAFSAPIPDPAHPCCTLHFSSLGKFVPAFAKFRAGLDDNNATRSQFPAEPPKTHILRAARAALRTTFVRAGRFVHSRRWLATAFGVTIGLLALIILVKQGSDTHADTASAPAFSASPAGDVRAATLADQSAGKTESPKLLITTAQYQADQTVGAELTGTIEEIDETPPPKTASNAYYQNVYQK